MLQVERFLEPPETIKKLWSQIPPNPEYLHEYVTPVIKWIKANAMKGDYILVQGDFGATYMVVDYCISHGYTPIYATTYRVANEQKVSDNKLITRHHFQHVKFRKYVRYGKP